ncbi:MAG TPA: sensor histidine kinase, partial [Thermodesulfobacteriota bacterium]|nr:sensor histidine kinase [Thermodesulfobacteriota bacterium]
MLIEACRGLENKVNQRTAELSKSLEEKEVLLKEIHHRVKNNMQMISSLIRLQSAKLEDEKSVKVFQECQNRIKSMALVHEALYRSNDFTTLNLSDYIKSLGNELRRSYNLNPERIEMDVDIKDVVLDMDTGITCGLILNELITNSIKHAFPDER